MKRLILLALIIFAVQFASAGFREGMNLTQEELNSIDFSDMKIFDCRMHYNNFYVGWDWDLGSMLYIPHSCLSIRDININESRKEKYRYTVYRRLFWNTYTEADFNSCMQKNNRDECEDEIKVDINKQYDDVVFKNYRLVESKQVKDRKNIFRNLKCEDIFDCKPKGGVMAMVDLYSCSDGRIKECPGGLSNPNAEGKQTRCYQNEEKNHWFYCKDGWQII